MLSLPFACRMLLALAIASPCLLVPSVAPAAPGDPMPAITLGPELAGCPVGTAYAYADADRVLADPRGGRIVVIDPICFYSGASKVGRVLRFGADGVVDPIWAAAGLVVSKASPLIPVGAHLYEVYGDGRSIRRYRLSDATRDTGYAVNLPRGAAAATIDPSGAVRYTPDTKLSWGQQRMRADGSRDAAFSYEPLRDGDLGAGDRPGRRLVCQGSPARNADGRFVVAGSIAMVDPRQRWLDAPGSGGACVVPLTANGRRDAHSRTVSFSRFPERWGAGSAWYAETGRGTAIAYGCTTSRCFVLNCARRSPCVLSALPSSAGAGETLRMLPDGSVQYRSAGMMLHASARGTELGRYAIAGGSRPTRFDNHLNPNVINGGIPDSPTVIVTPLTPFV